MGGLRRKSVAGYIDAKWLVRQTAFWHTGRTIMCSRIWIVCLTLACLSAAEIVHADDGAASIAAGGLVAKREVRVVMAKEVLRIAEAKVIVDYDFRNDAAQDVVTEVAFPVPPYENNIISGPYPEEESFHDFKLWVGGKTAQFQTQATATLKGKDVTAELNANHIDIPSLGHYTEKVDAQGMTLHLSPDFSRLPLAARRQLVKDGLYETFERSAIGRWTVHLQ
jgi:hypothetical protein